jgi:hypothetical protein
MKFIKLFCLITVVGVFHGCGGDSGLSTSLEGIYSITTKTVNETGCDSEGDSVLEAQNNKMLYVQIQEFFVQFLSAIECLDLAGCREDAGGESMILGGYTFAGGNDSDGWIGESTGAFSDFDNEGKCTGYVIDIKMTSTGEGTIKIESRRRESLPFDKDSEGFCDTDDAHAAAEGQPCVQYEVITAQFEEALP